MLHKRPLRYSSYAWLRRGLWFFGILNVVGVAGDHLPVAAKTGTLYAYVRDVVHDNSWWLVLVGTVGMSLCGIAMKICGSPSVWDTFHELLSDLQAAIFHGEGYEVPDHHKVTIFKAVPCCREDALWRRMFFCFSKRKRWLVPVVRSHHTSQDTKTCFSLHDESSKCCGVAGQAWARNQVLAVDGLPNVSDEPTRASNFEIEAYASRGFVTKEWIEKRKPHARAIVSMPLVAGGDIWGVLVFDSRSPEKIGYAEAQQFLTVVQRQINRLLSKHL